jgi:hypothetical protein
MPASHHLTIDAQTEDRPTGPELTATLTYPAGALADALADDVVEALATAWRSALAALTSHAARLRRR